MVTSNYYKVTNEMLVEELLVTEVVIHSWPSLVYGRKAER